MIRSGVDVIEVDRIEDAIVRFGDRFFERVFTAQEKEDAGGYIPSLAARFAAKEAVSKALGTGIGKVRWKEIEIIIDSQRRPSLRLHGEARSSASSQGLSDWSVSLSHTHELAIAMAVALQRPDRSAEIE